MRERLTTLDNEVRDTENTLARTQSRIEQVRKLISTGQMKINRHIEEIRPIVEGFGYTIDQDTNFTALILTLTQRQQRFQKEEERIQQCEQDLRAVENVLSSLGGEIQGKREEISRLSKRVEEQGRLLAERKDERYRLLGDRDAEEEERRLSERVAAAKRVFEAARATWDERMRVLQTHQGIKDDLNRRVDAANEEISRLEETFLSRIMEAGFADEAAYAAALMPPDEIARLAQVWDEISTEEMRIHERQMDAARRYQKERERNLSTLPKEQLLQERDAMHNEKNACLAEIGQYRERLVQDEERSRQQAQTLAERERQQRETDRWGRLDTLIGSADGKHFRNFAQGLTFSILLSHANRHLRRMTDRYILIQDTTMPLTMHVIDTGKEGVVRTVKNLSGGEVFLVSLALALGLSGMASQNVRVDSLFLDEGFGTLDNDTLETALSALSSLEQEGKLIGIISHVPALQERIPVRISIKRNKWDQSHHPACCVLIIPEESTSVLNFALLCSMR
jgi:exonuclease SbcC